MFFLRYESLKDYIRLYPVNAALIAVQLAAFAATSVSGGLRDARVLLEFGGLSALPQYAGEYWRLVSSVFLHAGFSHLLLNGFVQYIFAPPMERILGKTKYLAFFILCGTAGGLASLSLERPALAVGSSAAIYGLFGAYLHLVLFRRIPLDEGSRKAVQVLIVIGLIYSVLVSRVSFWGHVGGAIAGFLLVSPLLSLRHSAPGRR
ncbi:MAG: hypothetical protein BLM47_13520 [Candidatus Reconcilbacillus cellulovorans]|uniref:Peptidase S54 rhomboid domain-containing protein n=1 Tax=Candidatus Reconcilbacillus cellulovorans TaxID=1906605 RepID=A0A2A6DWV2_9BACL|nr:MAG: hypothetical protein BLM47_13520 [Candidatus Reconcilbacillus cellulovorans]